MSSKIHYFFDGIIFTETEARIRDREILFNVGEIYSETQPPFPGCMQFSVYKHFYNVFKKWIFLAVWMNGCFSAQPSLAGEYIMNLAASYTGSFNNTICVLGVFIRVWSREWSSSWKRVSNFRIAHRPGQKVKAANAYAHKNDQRKFSQFFRSCCCCCRRC